MVTEVELNFLAIPYIQNLKWLLKVGVHRVDQEQHILELMDQSDVKNVDGIHVIEILLSYE